MDNYDKQILDIIQSDFPLCSRPYEEVGRRVGLTEAETLARVRALKETGLIRRMGANYQSKKLGCSPPSAPRAFPKRKSTNSWPR